MPFSLMFDLGTVRDKIAEMTLAPNEAERSAISGWLKIEALNDLKATVRVSREGEDLYAYAARFEADVVQACVITLEPVPAHLSGEFQRSFRLLPRLSSRRRKPLAEPVAGVDVAMLGDEEPELLESAIVDLAAPVLEELSLALDPYPKCPGAAFEAPPDPEPAPENPFAVLQKLKETRREGAPSAKAKAGPGVHTGRRRKKGA